MRSRIVFPILLALLSWAIRAHAQSPAQPAQEAAARLEQRLATLRSLRADFEQIYYSASQSAPLEEKGRLFLQRPNRMRWEYTEPEVKVFIYREGIFEQYYAQDNQLIRSRLSGEESGTEILAFLTGEKKIRASYSVELDTAPDALKNTVSLKLIPLQEGEYSSILVEMNTRTSLPARLVFTDLAGNRSEFRFKKARTDLSLPARTFELKVPEDCEIIDEITAASSGKDD